MGTGNLLLGLAIWLPGRRAAPALEEETSPEGARRSGGPALLALAFASGFVSLAFEVSLFRAFSTLYGLDPLRAVLGGARREGRPRQP